MRRSLKTVLIFMLFLGAAACSLSTPAAQEATPTSQPYHSLTTRTGIEKIDQILDAVASRDAQSLRSLVEFTNAKCTKREGLGGPPKCLEGQEEGTPVDVLPFLSSEGHFLRKDEIDHWSGIQASALYAIYEVSPAVSSEQYYPAGKYVILFISDEPGVAIALRMGERGIVRVDDIFDPSPEALAAILQREASTVILPPKN